MDKEDININKELLNIIENDKTGNDIYNYVMSLKNVDELDLNFLIEKISEKKFLNIKTIYEIGKNWPSEKIDYKLLTKILLEKDKDGYWTYYAGKNWPSEKIDYELFIEFLIKKIDTKWLAQAIKEWNISKEKQIILIEEIIKRENREYYIFNLLTSKKVDYNLLKEILEKNNIEIDFYKKII